MDKVKQILEVLRKHHFWILCGLGALVGLIAWQMSTSSLDAEFQKDSQGITAKIKQVEDIAHDGSIPHITWKDVKDKDTEKLKEVVGDRWQKLYAEQKEKVFKWLDNLSAEDVAKLEAPGEYSRDLIDTYTEAIRSAPEQLTKIVSAPPPEAIPIAGSAAPAAPAGQYKVSWSPESLDTIRQSFDWVTEASTLIVRQAQEEFWVYKALCQVIQKVNEGSGGEVPIKQIIDMKIAYLAVEDSPGGSSGAEKRIDSIIQAATGDPAAQAPAPTGDTPTAVKPVLKDRLKPTNTGGPLFGGGAAGPAGPGGKDDEWKRFRYVKPTNPLASTGDPIREPAEYDQAVKTAKYLLMPFDLEVSIDDRYVDRLLVAMRNSVLPLEVQQVRVNPVSATTGFGGAANSYGGGGDHGGGAVTARVAQQMAERAGGVGGAAGQVPTSRYINVELRGVVYLLTPPNLNQPSSEAPAETPPGETKTALNTR